MTYNYNKDNSTGNPFQITKNLIKKDEGNLFVVGGTENEVFSLIVSSLLSANGSYLVWDPDCSIYKNTAEKMKEFRLVIWAMHGIYGAGKSLDETFGLIETVEKAAQIYMLTAGLERKNTIKDEDMVKLAEFFKVDYRKDFLNI